MLYLPVKRSWIISRSAFRVYFACTLASIVALGTIFATKLAMRFAGISTLEVAPPAAWIVRALLWPGIFGMAILSVAMWYFWFTFDQSGWLKRAIWFLPLYFLFMIGPIFYFFFVYLRNEEVKEGL